MCLGERRVVLERRVAPLLPQRTVQCLSCAVLGTLPLETLLPVAPLLWSAMPSNRDSSLAASGILLAFSFLPLLRTCGTVTPALAALSSWGLCLLPLTLFYLLFLLLS